MNNKSIFQSWINIWILLYTVLLAFSACVSTVESESPEPVEVEASAFETFLYEEVDDRMRDDPRFQRILDMHHRVSQNRKDAQRIVAQINTLMEELDILLADCAYPDRSMAYILSTSIVEPVNIAYYQRSIYRCEHYLNDSEIAMANSQNNLDYLGQLQRELERTLNNAIRECETRGMAEEYRYMLRKGVESYLVQANRRDTLYQRWIEDLELFAVNYVACMKDNRN